MHPNLFVIFNFLFSFCYEHNLPIVITSIKKHVDGRISPSHREGRAFDMSVKSWSKYHVDEFLREVNYNYKHIAARSYSDLKPRACIYHNIGRGNHIHCQVSKL